MYSGVIKNWQLHTLSTRKQVFTGTIEHDERGRFKDGWHIRSSEILAFNKDTGVLFTNNSEYKMDRETEGMDEYFPKDMGNSILGVFY